MSAAHNLYLELSSLGVMLWQEGGQLRYRAPVGTVVPGLIDRLKVHKSELLVMLTTPRALAPANDMEPVPEAMPHASDFWGKAALVRGDALLLTNHLVKCKACYARGGRYCEGGQRLRAAYEAKVEAVWH